MKRSRHKEWIKMYRAERGTFAQLPLMARALFRQILTVLADDAGVIQVGEREHAEAIAFALGADASDRRVIRRVLPVLHADGCIQLEPGRIVFPGYARFQDHTPTPSIARSVPEDGANGTRTERETDANGSRTDHELGTNGARTDHEQIANDSRAEREIRPNPIEPFNSGPRGIREEKSREEGDQSARATSRTALRQAFARAYEARRALLWNYGSEPQAFAGLAVWCEKQAAVERRPVADVCWQLVSGYFKAALTERYIVEKDYSIAILAKQPGRYYSPPDAAAPPAPSALHAELATLRVQVVEAVQAGDNATHRALVKRRREVEDQIRAEARARAKGAA